MQGAIYAVKYAAAVKTEVGVGVAVVAIEVLVVWS